MKLSTLILLLCILVTIALPLSAASSAIDIAIKINPGDIVSEDFKLSINSTEAYDAFSFATAEKPLSISYDGKYALNEENSSYVITFDKSIEPGLNEVSFTILYDNLIDNSGEGKVFRTNFGTGQYDSARISLTLPQGATLSREPSATPPPEDITTDGQRITLSWIFNSPDDAGIVVFYKGDSSNLGIILIAALVLLICIIIIVTGAVLWNKRKIKKTLTDILTEDEQKIVEELRKGVTKQSEIAKNLGFSKSKMSKVLRKLEVKELIEKQPWFKTNKLKLKKIK